MSTRYRLARDPDYIAKARAVLLPELGEAAWYLPEEKIVRCADAMLNSFAGQVAPLRTALRPVSEAIGRTRRGRLLGKLFGVYPPPPVDVYERLHELAEAIRFG